MPKGLAPPPNNSATAFEAQKKVWAKAENDKRADKKVQAAAREKREEEKRSKDNHRLNRTAAAEREDIQRQGRKEKDLACKEAARKRKEKEAAGH